MDKKSVVYTYIYEYTCEGTLLSYKKNDILTFATTWIVESIMLRKISQTEKDKCCMISLTCGT